MASVAQRSAWSPLPNLRTVHDEAGTKADLCDGQTGFKRREAATAATAIILAIPERPTSSADPVSERIDPVAFLARPVEGFHHPRQHFFTDRLIGRFYEDSSLDAETRKSSKCLASRLDTARSSSSSSKYNNSNSTRPNTTAGGSTAPGQFRSSNSPATTRRGKRMQENSSAQALGTFKGRGLSGGSLSSRKDQVEREILEQKALIDKLEGRMAALSSRGRRKRADSGHIVEDIDSKIAVRGSTALGQEEDALKGRGDDRHRATSDSHRTKPSGSVEGLGGSEDKDAVKRRDYTTEIEGVIAIQAAARGRNTRCRVGQMRTVALERERCANKIQALERGRVARRQLSAASQATSRDRSHPRCPAGSGRAVVVAAAAASVRGGLLVSPDSYPINHGREVEYTLNAIHPTQVEGGLGLASPNGHQPRSTPLSEIGVDGIGVLLCANGFDAEAPDFAAQAVDGIMLSDPQLCEADFAELDLGGSEPGAKQRRARMVSFFRRCQREGIPKPYEGLAPGFAPTMAAPAAGVEGSPASGTNHVDEPVRGAGSVDKVRQRLLRGASTSSAKAQEDSGSSSSSAEKPLCAAPSSRHLRTDQPQTATQGHVTKPDGHRYSNEESDSFVDAQATTDDASKPIPVKLNEGVVVTIGGQETDLVHSYADTGSFVAYSSHGAGEWESLPTASVESDVTSRARRSSLGVPTILLDLELGPRVAVNNFTSEPKSICLPPEIPVAEAAETVNVFR